MRTKRRLRPATLIVAGTLPVAALAAPGGASANVSSSSVPATAPAAAAPATGALSRYDVARKDCVGTARNGRSKVWFTVAGGVLSDVYYPTIDNTEVESLQYVVTDGATF